MNNLALLILKYLIMKKMILTAFLLTATMAVFAQDSSSERKRPRGCREWYLVIFNVTILAHHSDACNNSHGNWDWGANGENQPLVIN